MKIEVFGYCIEIKRGLSTISFRHKDDPGWATRVEYFRMGKRYMLADILLPSLDAKTLEKIFTPMFKRPWDYQAAAYYSKKGVRMNTRPIARKLAQQYCHGNTNKWTLLVGFDNTQPQHDQWYRVP